VRFCFLPTDALTPRQYQCLPGTAALEDALEPKFVAVDYGRPAYMLLSGDCPLAVWQGADDAAEMGAFHALYAPQSLNNLRTRLDEYLPFGLEAGIFLVPSRAPATRAQLPTYAYGRRLRVPSHDEDLDALQALAIGVALI
jgi:hypothetical protein